MNQPGRYRVTIIIIIILSAIILLIAASVAMGAVWTASPTIIVNNDAAHYRGAPALAVQADGVAHIVYEELIGIKETHTELIYKTNQSGVWVKDAVTSNELADVIPALSVYGGKPRIVWRRGAGVTDSSSEIMYARRGGGSWTIKKLSKNSYADDLPRIATAKGKDHVVWVGYDRGVLGDGDIYYKTNATSDGKWRQEKIIENDIEEDMPDIAVWGRGRVHLVFAAIDPTAKDREIMYATRISGRWEFERLTTAPNFEDDDPAIAVYKGRVYVAFSRAPKGSGIAQLYLAVKSGGVWTTKRLTAQAGGIFGRPQITAKNGVVRIVYTRMNIKTGRLDINYQAKADGPWVKEAIVQDPSDSMATGLGAANGQAHIVYESWDSSSLTGGIYYRKQE